MSDLRQAPVAAYEALGDITLGDQLGVGELSLDQHVRVAPGRWRALLLDDDARDDLGVAASQLVLIHAEHPGFELPALRFALRVPIEAARFTAADLALAALLATDDGFYDYLDGTHGVLDGGRGVHVMWTGDGVAHVWVEDAVAPRFVVVELA